MPRAFPSQIVRYLTEVYGKGQVLDQSSISATIGAVVGFLKLYDEVPDELIQLSVPDYAALVAAVGTIRFGIDQFRFRGTTDCLRPVGKALTRAWGLIEKLRDEVPSTTHDLSFIKDAALQEMIGLDIAAISTDLQSGEWKGATILAGSCCEALLLYGLQSVEAKAPGKIAKALKAVAGSKKPSSSDLTDKSWDVSSYTEVAHHLGLISDNTKSEIDPARDYRNLIHPAKSIREKVKCDRGTAFVGAGAVDHVISDLKKNL